MRNNPPTSPITSRRCAAEMAAMAQVGSTSSYARLFSDARARRGRGGSARRERRSLNCARPSPRKQRVITRVARAETSRAAVPQHALPSISRSKKRDLHVGDAASPTARTRSSTETGVGPMRRSIVARASSRGVVAPAKRRFSRAAAAPQVRLLGGRRRRSAPWPYSSHRVVEQPFVPQIGS